MNHNNASRKDETLKKVKVMSSVTENPHDKDISCEICTECTDSEC